MSCSPFWLDDPQVLLKEATEFFPFTEHDRRCTSSALNSFTRFGIYLSILLAVVRLEVSWLLVGVAFALFSLGAWKFMEKSGAVREGFGEAGREGFGEGSIQEYKETKETSEEGFTNHKFNTAAPILDPRDVINEYVPDVIGLSVDQRTHPTPANPFMNVLLTEIGDNPQRNPAKNVDQRATKTALDSYFQTMFANDPGDVFNHTQSQRNWVTMPSTTIPNDQSAFANWLYRVPGQTCKEGNTAACNFNTGAEALPWREIRALT